MPPEVLEAILEFLELEPLCTAHLVSNAFCAAASMHVRGLNLKATSQGPLDRFPRLLRVSFCGSLQQLNPRVRDIITTASAIFYKLPVITPRTAQKHSHSRP
jgi:hypothetical protein